MPPLCFDGALEQQVKNALKSSASNLGGDMVSTRISKLAVHAERVVTLVKQSL